MNTKNGAPSPATPAQLIVEVQNYLTGKFADLEFTLYPNHELMIGHTQAKWEVQFMPVLYPHGQVKGYRLAIFSKDGAISGNRVFYPADGRHGAMAEEMCRLAFGDHR
jgi:hypothetical protein